MKQSNSKLIFAMAIVWALVCGSLQAQVNLNMANNGVTGGSPFSIAPPGTCFFNFYDFGGPLGNYNNGANASVTFLPANAATHRIQVSFSTFSLEPRFDAFYIYNSNTVGTNQVPGPQGATLSGFPAGNWQDINPGTVTANTGIAAVGTNAAEALTFQFRSDQSIAYPGWTAIVRQTTKTPCTMTAPPNLALFTGPGATNCGVVYVPTLPVISGGCDPSYELRYRINGGVQQNLFLAINAPVGFNIITWELIDPCGGAVIASVNQNVNVTDNTPPTVSCPPNQTINLAGGECGAVFSYEVNCMDNCPFNVNQTVNLGFDFNNSQAGIMFDVVNLSSNPLTITQFGPSLSAGTWPMEVYFTHTASTWVGSDQNPSAWTLAGSFLATSTGPGAGTPIPGFGIVLPPGASRGIYLTSKTGTPVNYKNSSGQGGDTNLRVSSNPGAGKAYPFATTYTGREYKGFVRYSTTSSQAPLQISGKASGEFLDYHDSPFINVFQCTDVNGNTTTCSFTVTVKPYPNPVTSLKCNDFITIALDEGCTGVIGADDVLEGGPYGCYADYEVRIDRTLPLGNGPWEPPILYASDVGKTYRVRTRDNVGNQCFTDIKVIDSKPPILDCSPVSPVTVPCNFPIDPIVSKNTTLTLRFAAQGLTPVTKEVVDFQTREYTFNVYVPQGTMVTDVDFKTKITGDGFNNNLQIQLENPSSTKVMVWNKLGGCAPDPIFVRFDDEGSGAFNCATYTTGINAQVPLGFGVLSTFDTEPAYGIWKVRVTDVDGFGDHSFVDLAELYLMVTGNFSTGLPHGLIPLTPAHVIPNGPNSFNVPVGLDPCGPATLTYFDQVVPQTCSSIYTKVITRHWTATDLSGNKASCDQIINLLRPTFNDIVMPPNFDGIDQGVFDCDDPYPTPAWIQSQGLQGFPEAFGCPGFCNLNVGHSDSRVAVCDGSYDIVRTWTVIDPCAPMGSMTHQQVLRVRDDKGPMFIDPLVNLVETTDPYTCCATFKFPDIIVRDYKDCSRVNNVYAQVKTIDPVTGAVTNIINVSAGLFDFPGNNPTVSDTLVSFSNMACIPIGQYTVCYIATDDCGNTSSTSFQLTIADYSPPQPSCDETTIVSIGVDDPTDCYYNNPNNCEFAGITWVRATTFDDGSYDQCSPVKFKVRRAEPYSDCINSLDHGYCSGNPYGLSEFDLATIESDSIKFYCCEVGTTQTIILRVYQLNIDGTTSSYPDGTPIYNECQVQVTVQDKLKPVCEPPFNVTVSCDAFDPSLWSYGKAKAYDNCCLDASKEYLGQKGLTHSANYSQFDSVCNKGTIVRTFRVFDCKGASSQCTQRIVVNYNQNYYIKFPDDKVINVCDGTGLYDEPKFFGKDCELLGVTYEDQLFTVVPDACFKIERNWKVINWCTYNPNGQCIAVPNPTPNSNISHSSNLPGPIVSPVQTSGDPWKSTIVKVNPTDVSTTNYSIFYDANANCYTYKQIIKVIDTQAPNIQCPASPVTFCDLTTNNPQLWNEQYWYDPVAKSHDLCEAPTDLSIVASDLCSGPNLTVRYLLFLDLDGDGTMETVVNSTSPPPAGTVNYNNFNTPNFGGGTSRIFDERLIPITQKFKFTLQTTTTGNNVTAAVRWNTQTAQNTFAVPELPYGTHKIKWIVGDGCGNEGVCEYTFVVKDCKAPTVVCINGLSANLPVSGSLTIFASDFLLHADDNCTPQDYLEFGIRKSGTGAGFPVDLGGNPVISQMFTCDELGTQPVELWAIDAAGNADFCETYLIVQDNSGFCISDMATVSGALKTESNDGLEESDVELSGQHQSGPAFNYFSTTNSAGTYGFVHSVPVFSNYKVTPTKDDNPLNGLTTYDLVLISKHILGIQPLGSPYKMIAADANMSNSITTFDIVEFRKLILGIYQELPNNTSWRFVDKSYAFPNPDNPFASPFPESKSVADIQTNAMADDFVAVKIGDVNNTAVANSFMVSEDRSVGALIFDVDDREVKAGEVIDVTFKAAETVAGYQFTLNYNDFELVDIVSSDNMGADNFAIFPDESTLTTSWNGDKQAAFTLKLRARRAGELSKMLTLSSRITKAEAYRYVNANQQEIEPLSITLRFNGKSGSVLTGVGFELYQNQPNPFVSRTSIGFHLPEATTAHLTVYDQAGRLVYSQKGDFAKGYNSFMLDKAMVNTSGVLFYTVETNTDSATKKMVQAK